MLRPFLRRVSPPPAPRMPVLTLHPQETGSHPGVLPSDSSHHIWRLAHVGAGGSYQHPETSLSNESQTARPAPPDPQMGSPGKSLHTSRTLERN